jgi:hypothetical protein
VRHFTDSCTPRQRTWIAISGKSLVLAAIILYSGSAEAATVTITGGTYIIDRFSIVLPGESSSSFSVSLTGDNGFSLYGAHDGGFGLNEGSVSLGAAYFQYAGEPAGGGFSLGKFDLAQQPDGSWTGTVVRYSPTGFLMPPGLELYAPSSTLSRGPYAFGERTTITFGQSALITPEPASMAFIVAPVIIFLAMDQASRKHLIRRLAQSNFKRS